MILLADDEPVRREIATALLERNGHSGSRRQLEAFYTEGAA